MADTGHGITSPESEKDNIMIEEWPRAIIGFMAPLFPTVEVKFFAARLDNFEN